MSAPFSPALFGFLTDLKRNNDREWFRENRDRYDADVKEPALRFVAAFSGPLRKISPHFVADPRPVGGSLFRIHRDTRFSRDKSPYKVHVGIHFRHARGKDVHAPGFYLHLEPGNVFLGAGIWHPETKTLLRIREAIVDDPARWKRISKAKRFRDAFELAGDSLKRPPRGFDPEHPLVEDLRRKDFIAVRNLSQKEACSPGFTNRVADGFRTAGPFVRFLTEALDLEY